MLFGALLLVVVGSLAGEWLSIQDTMSDTVSFYFGHQGYEYVDLGRAWQIALFASLLLWLFLMLRVLRPALRQSGNRNNSSPCSRYRPLPLPCSTARTDLGTTYASFDGRVLAVVGRALVGGRVF